MQITQFVRARRALRSQSGFSSMQVIVGLGAATTLAGLVAMNSDEQVGAAEQTACEYDKTVVQTAIEAYKASNQDFVYPEAAGVDGLDELRSAGWLRNESKYWQFLGVDGTGAPQLVVRTAIAGCD